jgi:hypothetical protein
MHLVAGRQENSVARERGALAKGAAASTNMHRVDI